MEEKKEVGLFELRDLVLGRTVYHPNAGFSKEPVVLNGIRLQKRTNGTDVQVELLYPDGKYQWTGINGLATIPEYSKKKNVREYAYDIINEMHSGEVINDVSIKMLAEIALDLTKDVQGAKGW